MLEVFLSKEELDSISKKNNVYVIGDNSKKII
jgi:hypothetical protein